MRLVTESPLEHFIQSHRGSESWRDYERAKRLISDEDDYEATVRHIVEVLGL